MTIKNLKALIEQELELVQKRHVLISKREDVRFDQDKSKFNAYCAEIDKIDNIIKQIGKKYMNYTSIFEVRACDLAKQIKELADNDIPNSCGIEYLCLGNYENFNYGTSKVKNFRGIKKMSVYINSSENCLIHENTTVDLRNNIQFMRGQFIINLLDILYKRSLINYDLIAKACWNTIEQKIKKAYSENLIKENNEKVSLLMKKLEILQNEELRNIEVERLKNEIKEINKHNNLLNKPFNLNISKIKI